MNHPIRVFLVGIQAELYSNTRLEERVYDARFSSFY